MKKIMLFLELISIYINMFTNVKKEVIYKFR